MAARIPFRAAALPSSARDETRLLLRVKLVKKLALCLNGVDLTPFSVGDIFACNDIDGRMLLAEGWASLPSDDEGIHNEPPEPSVSSIIESFRAGKKERRLA